MDNEIIIVCFSNVVHVYVSTLLPFHRLARDCFVTLTMVLCEVLFLGTHNIHVKNWFFCNNVVVGSKEQSSKVTK